MMIQLTRAPGIFRVQAASNRITFASESVPALLSRTPMELFALEHGSGNEMNG